MKPGIYRDMDSATYFGDPCDEPSLSQSIAKIILDHSPLHAKLAHPRLTLIAADDDEEPEKYIKAQAIGNAAHKIMLARGKEIDVLSYNDFRTKEAKLARELAEKAGRTVILEKHMSSAKAMVAAAFAQIERHEANLTFKDGTGEVAIVCQDDGVWLRSLVDWLGNDLRRCDDYKSGGVSVAPHVIGLRMVDQGWDIQAAMQERILDVLDPAGSGRRCFRFIAQENKPPYALTVCQLSEATMTMGRKKLQVAINAWKLCRKRNTWPGYTTRVVIPEYPGWQETRWLDRELSGEFEADTKLIMAG